ncbi:hypothetical protein HIM_03587 [Hirsutella minnesotensis 3608]|uniref:Uncharacterized protein n=1 Tax=Hirsutella minnesotensis 3608 TaxID=1043627 RepID=A0A0F7ZMI3_9HYPO|nr:hypothetical protein HIM_03587 [Hirsutella minnesotensis 3608]
MPRASGSGKRQQGAGAGSRDSKHDNGLVVPGRRVSAKKSNGQLNGSARSPDHGQPHSPPQPQPSSSPSLPSGVANPKKRTDDASSPALANANAAAAASVAAPPSSLDCRPRDSHRRASFGTHSESSSESCQSGMGANGHTVVVDGSHRQIDVNAMKNSDVHRDSGPLELAATVVRSLPIQDTLAILIILMHIPYLSLTMVYACFASLTFVPPVASKAGWNINFGDIFDSNSHTPSLATVMCMDFFFFLIWVFLWPPLQDSMLEFAKPVIAVTLGGGTSTKHGTSRGVPACFTWVLLHKLVRASTAYWPRLSRHLPDAWRMRAVFSDSFTTATAATTASSAASAATVMLSHAPYDKRDTHGWIQSILAIHILTQGIVRYIREWYLRRERFHAATGTSEVEASKSPAASASGGPASVGGSGAGDSAHDNTATGIDSDIASPTPGSHPVAMTKKKRKQSAQVRLQQPLWAALASTKIVAMKEIELSSWASGSSDKRDIHNSGNTPSFYRQPKQIWISYIGSDEVCFNTSRFPDHGDESPRDIKSSSHVTRPVGVDTSKPFYVKINNAYWQPTRIFPVEDSDDGHEGLSWTGDIYGLRPASKYVCEFVDVQTDQILFTTSIRTVKEPMRDHDVSTSPGLPNGQQPLRPDSPATTLRTSIAAAEAKLADEKNRLKTWRKEWKLRINTLKKENELADNQLSSAGNNDEKYKQKIRQQETQKAQAERDTQSLTEQLKNFDTAPELTERKKKAERAYATEKKVFDAAQKELRDHQARLEKEVKAKEVEKSNLNTRRNKIATRIAKVENELANISDANSRGLDEAERRRQERVKWLEQAAAIEHNYIERLSHVVAANNGKRDHVRTLQAQLQPLQSFLNPINGMSMDVGSPLVSDAAHQSFQRSSPWNPTPTAPTHYPAGLWATSSSDLPAPIAAPSRPPGLSPWNPPQANPLQESRGAKARGRSSSMLSDVSGFTQASDDGPRSPTIGPGRRPQPLFGRRNGASGSSGSSGSGSLGDPWSRLLSPLSSGTSRQDQAKDPAKRLHRFEKEYGNLLSTWRRCSDLSRDTDAAETLEIYLQELTNILSDESRRPLPHPCIQYASLKQIYVPIGKIATTSYDEWIIKEAVLFFATLIESEEEAFVENHTFSASLTNLLVRITSMNGVRLGLDTESRVVELAFNITTKIRLDPDILPAWFKPSQPPERERERDAREHFAGRTQRADFPLFYILMDYIHHEGKVGDFARTGLLYIIEAASSSASLEQWIVESDLSTLMATGLGALYSQLSRKLVIDHLPHDLPPILALSDYQHPVSNYDIVSSCSPEFQSHLETFLSHLLFWQDVLNHCRSVDVRSTLLEHFQAIFLQQLLYPSLLESSDIDGGSSVAVLTYLRRILESLDHPDMIKLILHYLLALPDAPTSKERSTTSSVSVARKRKSMDLATMMAEKSSGAVTPLLFNLVDLILACLRSRNQQTIHVTLQLVSAILKRHHRYAVITLLKTEVLPSNTVDRTVGAHEQEVEYLISLASSIGGYGDFDDFYGNILNDTMIRLETHPCSLKLVAPRVSSNNLKMPTVPDSPPGAPRDVREHSLRIDDPLLNATLDLLETFFVNPVEMNLSVTETIVDLAICGYMSIEGWLARSPKTYVFVAEEGTSGEFEKNGSDDDDRYSDMSASEEPLSRPLDTRRGSISEAQRLEALEKCRQRPQWSTESIPRILSLLKRLCDQVALYKEKIPRFEDLLQQRREAFQAAETMLDVPQLVRRASPSSQSTPERPSPERAARTGSPSRPSALEGFAQRLLLELGTPSRSGSPRGRKERGRESGTSSPAGATAGLSESSMPRGVRSSPKDLPANYAESNRSGVGRNFSPGSGQGPGYDPRDAVAASQASAFAAIDQSILARRVGLPDDTLKPIPINLERSANTKPSEEREPDADNQLSGGVDDKASGIESPTTKSEGETASPPPEEIKVSVSHILTNVIIFQSFLLELAGLMQVRAGLFGEVRYV